MSVSIKKLGAGVILMLSGALLQSGELVSIAGIKPNLLIGFGVGAAASLGSFWLWLLAIIAGTGLLQQLTHINLTIFALIPALLLAFIAVRFFPWRAWLNIAVSVALSTLVLYAVIDMGYLTQSWLLVSGEILYNACAGVAVYYIFIQLFS